MRAVADVVADTSEGPTIELLHGQRRVGLPEELVALLLTVARAAASGEDVAVVVGERESSEELTSQQVADLLNVSRPYVVKLARRSVLPHRMVGNRHRFSASDVLAYKEREERRREKILAGLAPLRVTAPRTSEDSPATGCSLRPAGRRIGRQRPRPAWASRPSAHLRVGGGVPAGVADRDRNRAATQRDPAADPPRDGSRRSRCCARACRSRDEPGLSRRPTAPPKLGGPGGVDDESSQGPPTSWPPRLPPRPPI